jgi:hypothetical protein
MRYIHIIFLSFIFCQNNDFGGGPNMFYNNMFSAREVAMGGTGIANAQGYMSNLWNPANIVNSLDSNKAIFGFNSSMGNENEVSKNWLTLGVIGKKIFEKQQKEIYLGGTIFHESYNDIVETIINTNNEIVPVSQFNLHQQLFLFSLSGKFETLSLGISGKMILTNHIYAKHSVGRYGVDIGFLLKYPNPVFPLFNKLDEIKYGFVLKSDFDKHNQQLLTGMGASFIKNMNNSSVSTLSFDVVTGDFHQPEVHVGADLLILRGKKLLLEERFLPLLNFYLGGSSDKNAIKSISGGLGFHLPLGLKLDFSYSKFQVPYLKLLNGQVRFTIQKNLHRKKT